jgi:hypothetical protein
MVRSLESAANESAGVKGVRQKEAWRTEPLSHLSFVRVSEGGDGCVRRFG